MERLGDYLEDRGSSWCWLLPCGVSCFVRIHVFFDHILWFFVTNKSVISTILSFSDCPHLLVLDEPTNYLDREALGALSAALNEWGGAVLMISHNKEFYSSVCSEEWLVADGKVTVVGDSSEREMKAVAKKKPATKKKPITCFGIWACRCRNKNWCNQKEKHYAQHAGSGFR